MKNQVYASSGGPMSSRCLLGLQYPASRRTTIVLVTKKHKKYSYLAENTINEI